MNSDNKRLRGPAALLVASFALGSPVLAQIEILSTVQHQSVTPAGVSYPKAVTPDGRFVVVASTAPNLVPDQVLPTCETDLFLLDTLTGLNLLVSHRFGQPTRCTGSFFEDRVSVSDDGRFVLFESSSPDLLAPGLDDNAKRDVFLFDSQSGDVRLVSRRRDDPTRPVAEGGSDSFLSANGNLVVFSSLSSAAELVPSVNDSNKLEDTFALDLSANTMSLVSHRVGDPGTTASSFAAPRGLTPEGRFVLVMSNATDLVASYVPGPTYDRQIYRYDRTSGAFQLISHRAGHPTAGGDSETLDSAGISQDGRFVAFSSDATDLVSGQIDPNQTFDAFLGDLDTGATTLVSAAAGLSTTTANDASAATALTPNGRFVLFQSDASNLVSGMVDDFSRSEDVFLYDRVESTVRLVSRTSVSPLEARGFSSPVGLSADGSRVLFFHVGSQLWSFDKASSEAKAIAPASWQPFATAAGAGVFGSSSPFLVPIGDENGLIDVFRAPPDAESAELLTLSAGPSPRTTAGGSSTAAALTPDGRFLLWTSTANYLFPGDTNNSSDAFLFDRRSRTLRLVSPVAGQPNVPAGASTAVAITPAGRHVLLSSCSTLVVNGTSGPPCQIYLHDSNLGQSQLVTHVAGQPLVGSSGRGTALGLSDDGRFILFLSSANDLVSGFVERNTGPDLYLYDASTGQTVLVSHAANQATATGNGYVEEPQFFGSGRPTLIPRLTPDGRFVLFTSRATDHAIGYTDLEPFFDAFLYDRSTGLIEPIGVTAADPTRVSAAASIAGDLTPDGRFIAFASTGTDLVAGVTDPAETLDVFVRDRLMGTTQLISHRGESPTSAAGGLSFAGQITPNGRWVTFQSAAPDLLPSPGPNPPTSEPNVFVYDRTLARSELVSQSADPRSGGNGASTPTGITSSGRWVMFDSAATNLQAGIGSGTFLYDRSTQRQVYLGGGQSKGLSADGNTVTFSAFSRLVPNDTNNAPDVAVYSTEIFVDGFESGSTAAWSSATP